MAATYLKYVMPQERFEMLMGRYKKFIASLDEPYSEAVKVFDPLKQKNLDELRLIREASAVLQQKKEDEMRRLREEENKVVDGVENEETDAEEKVEYQ